MANYGNPILAVSDESISRQIYESVLPEMKALAAGDVKQINLEIPSTISTVFGVVPKLRLYRDQVALLPGNTDMKQFDSIENYNVALAQANSYHIIATQPPDDLEAVQGESVTLRDMLYADVLVQVRRGFINEASLNGLKGPVGYKNLASDLDALSSIYFSNWSKLSGSTSVKQAEIDRAQQLSLHLFRVVGLREQNPAIAAETADNRARAFTLLTNAYDNARRAIIYLRWHEGDADMIAPSLYAGRGNGRKKPVDENPAKPGAPVTPIVTQPVTPTPGTNTAGGNSPIAHASSNQVGNNGPFMQ